MGVGRQPSTHPGIANELRDALKIGGGDARVHDQALPILAQNTAIGVERARLMHGDYRVEGVDILVVHGLLRSGFN